jgi:hypothetical protein
VQISYWKWCPRNAYLKAGFLVAVFFGFYFAFIVSLLVELICRSIHVTYSSELFVATMFPACPDATYQANSAWLAIISLFLGILGWLLLIQSKLIYLFAKEYYRMTFKRKTTARSHLADKLTVIYAAPDSILATLDDI